MKEEKVSTEVLLTKIEGLTELINSRFDDNVREHFALLEQAKRTNGRVTVLEDKVQMIEKNEERRDGVKKGVKIFYNILLGILGLAAASIVAVAAIIKLQK